MNEDIGPIKESEEWVNEEIEDTKQQLAKLTTPRLAKIINKLIYLRILKQEVINKEIQKEEEMGNDL